MDENWSVVVGGPLDDNQAEVLRHGPPQGVAVLLLAVIGLAVALYLVRQPGTGGTAAPNVASTTSTLRSPSSVRAAPAAEAGGIPWPTPADDHDPRSSGVPGPGLPLVDDAEGRTILYVNTDGAPTLIDLATGARRQVDVASNRLHDRFLVELGEVVTDNPADRNRPPAGERAIPVYVHRALPADTDGLPESWSPPGPGIHLCLSVEGCAASRWTSDPAVDGVDTVRPLDSSRPELLAIFDPTIWTPDGRWLVAPDSLGESYRVPAPLPGAPIWLIEQPVAG